MITAAWIQERRDPTPDELEAWLEAYRLSVHPVQDMGTWNEPAWLAFLERNA